MPELVEPSADEGVATLDLMIYEAEWESSVHSFDPQRQATQFHSQWVEVNGIDAAFYDMATQYRFQPCFKVIVIGRAGNEFFIKTLFAVGALLSIRAGQQANEGSLAVRLDSTMMLQGCVQGIGEKA